MAKASAAAAANTPTTKQLLAKERHSLGSSIGMPAKFLREWTRKMAEADAKTAAEFAALPTAAKAYLSQTDEFRRYMSAIAFDAAMGNRELTKAEQFALSFFKGSLSRIREKRSGELAGYNEPKAPIIEVEPEDIMPPQMGAA